MVFILTHWKKQKNKSNGLQIWKMMKPASGGQYALWIIQHFMERLGFTTWIRNFIKPKSDFGLFPITGARELFQSLFRWHCNMDFRKWISDELKPKQRLKTFVQSS